MPIHSASQSSLAFLSSARPKNTYTREILSNTSRGDPETISCALSLGISFATATSLITLALKSRLSASFVIHFAVSFGEAVENEANSVESRGK
jgi:hypothetical protein